MDIFGIALFIGIVAVLVIINLKLAESLGIDTPTSKWVIGLGTCVLGFLVTGVLVLVMIIQLGTGNYGKH